MSTMAEVARGRRDPGDVVTRFTNPAAVFWRVQPRGKTNSRQNVAFAHQKVSLIANCDFVASVKSEITRSPSFTVNATFSPLSLT